MSEIAKDEVPARVVTALHVIVESIKRYPTAGQTRTLVAFVAGLYNGPEYPFDLTELRGLDLHLCQACLNALAFNCVRTGGEVHEWGVFEDRDLHRWMEREGISPRVIS